MASDKQQPARDTAGKGDTADDLSAEERRKVE